MLVVPKAIADKPQAVTFYNMMDYKPNALLGIIIAITMIIINTLIILILLIIKTSLSTPSVLLITTKSTIIIFAIKIKMSHPCFANHRHYHPGASVFLILISKCVISLQNTFIHTSLPTGLPEELFSENHILQSIASQTASS